MGIRGFERRLERMVEGAFARAFKSGLRPVELGRRLVREMDDNRSVGVRGGTVVPNAFTVALCRRATSSSSLRCRTPSPASSATRPASTLATRATRSWGRSRSSSVVDERLHTGAFQITGGWPKGVGGSGAGSLVLPTGDRFALTESVISVGRHPRVQHRARRPQRQPQPRRDPAPGRPVRRRRPRFHQRHPGQRGARSTRSSCKTATRSPSATPACASRPPEPMSDQLPQPRSKLLPAACCSTSSSCACCGRCGPRSTRRSVGRVAAEAASETARPTRHRQPQARAARAAHSSPPPS